MSNPLKHKQLGFTLVELVTVIILLGVVGTFSSRFISDNVVLYQASVNQNERLNDARFVLNRMSKELESAIAFSVQEDGSCIKFAPFTAAGQYLNSVSGQTDVDLIMDPLSRSGSRAVSTFINQRLSIHTLDANAFYQSASGSIATINSYAASGANATQAQVGLDAELTMDSSVSRYFIFNREVRYCLESSKSELLRYEKVGTGIETRALMMNDLSAGSSMSLTAASQFSNAILKLNFNFLLRDGSDIKFEHQVVMTNVP
ncbi:MAG: prepilin-type N-terminal cleavage/methylation domain-containing protein [Moritella sp.]|uniref:PulJ/GspJ family protein n=1 Tax=Moritella sp. TaxID=78556 RepID=UPI0029A47DE5|nr:prepilin-type N-terminal cleavage/methylation domain-containing protein [Moritella sp.]MDX2320635.1 prepilin-type N-terminal cleavage/methylation domain-containing protein [Moritella sp.]